MSCQSRRHANLQQMRDDKACEFLLASTKFIEWYNRADCQQLVIVGEMVPENPLPWRTLWTSFAGETSISFPSQRYATIIARMTGVDRRSTYSAS